MTLAAPDGLPAVQRRLACLVAGDAQVVGDQAPDVKRERGVRDGRDRCVQAVFPRNVGSLVRRAGAGGVQDAPDGARCDAVLSGQCFDGGAVVVGGDNLAGLIRGYGGGPAEGLARGLRARVFSLIMSRCWRSPKT